MLNFNVNTHSCFNRIDESVRHADRFFTNRNGLFDAMPACWQHTTEEESRKLCSLFDTFTGSWSVDNVKEVMRLCLCSFNDIPKLRGCYFMTKEYSSVFVETTTSEELEDNNPTPNIRQ